MTTIDTQALIRTYPLLSQLMALEEVCWFNPAITTLAAGLPYVGLDATDIQDASTRLQRFAPYLMRAFPETVCTNGLIESALLDIPHMQQQLEQEAATRIHGRLLLKQDSHLPISGSIKARGGIYAVLVHAEERAMAAGLLAETDDYDKLADATFRQFFRQYHIAVGSTGNLGLSIGIISARLGFSVTVHMSADARQWKKDKLRAHGVTVIEYDQDYGVAVAQGRKAAENDPACFFIDDE
ncbi:MAG: D-serine ammonia-lyase, partial [Thiothrix sp.]|nr:D-serine ammonia-lyase [Thiothrix sp.]